MLDNCFLHFLSLFLAIFNIFWWFVFFVYFLQLSKRHDTVNETKVGNFAQIGVIEEIGDVRDELDFALTAVNELHGGVREKQAVWWGSLSFTFIKHLLDL